MVPINLPSRKSSIRRTWTSVSSGDKRGHNVATLDQSSEKTFAISANADRLLSSLSGDFADILLKVAESRAKQTLPDGTPLVTVGDIKAAMTGMCDVLDEQVRLGKVETGIADGIKALREFCTSIPSESGSVRSPSPDQPG